MTAIKTNFARAFDVRLERTQVFNVRVEAKTLDEARRAASAEMIKNGVERYLLASDPLEIVEVRPAPLRGDLAMPKRQAVPSK